MHLNNYLLSLSLLFLCFHCISQPGNQYVFQKDDSLLKAKYADAVFAKKEVVITSLGKENFIEYKKAYDESYKNIGDFLTSSRAVTSPKELYYLQSLVQLIVKANPELQQLDTRVVFSRDWWPNAYSMGDGTIAVNAGLLIYLDNEAELVYILCHELSHFYLDHTGKAIKKYVETVSDPDFQKELKRLSKQQYKVNERLKVLTKTMVFDNRRHSRSNEAEADIQGYKFMKRTGFDCSSILSALSVLDHIDDTSLYKPVAVENIFNFSDYPFKNRWIEKESAIFSSMTDNSDLTKAEKDSLKSHPDCSKRIVFLKDSIAGIKMPGKKFLVDENLFRQLKKDFYIEMSEECFHEERLSRYLYYNLQMLQAGENLSVAIPSIARCFNLMYKKQKEHAVGLSLDAEGKDFPADYNELLRMLNRIRLEEIAAINTRFCKKYEAEMAGNKVFENEMKKANAIINN